MLLYEGDSPDPRRCDRIGKVVLEGLPPGPPRPVAVTLKVEGNGTKHLIVETGGLSKEAVIQYDPERVLPEEELRRRRAFIDTVEVV